LKEMEDTGADMVIGSRFINKEGFQSSFTRRVGIRFFEKLIKIVSGKRITDATSGFRMVNRKIINEFCEYYPKDYPEPESIV
ncbi:glycosyltransferase family 2 protein, partial [Klebsiella pneumoniae]|nr:glycosyltransferase family 2 protein [Klebsiella pneumoniae]